ncbi:MULTISPECIES: DNA-3-methyladenine glycosylase family protein [unclassified Streptomyces]|uniref:DNA-3-methyladenine glycosylase family protein n=1 Tax=unclassified Streptomyces TaxID=2593676 RepID=UPI0004C88B62|nr:MULTISPECIES: 3-methyladenine DNA glycosylase [unclassified Streptomyces]MDX2728553.1 DNA-3-methyladenine glycosylase 2 family protein [Streptomyces sp. PA03-2a]WSQ29226.1 DNA-3-methyladenine glycosylase 2 family protein [Streptomyces sp. NBC_01230]SCZ05245.1 3-methyladenine DNA glycosylase/8-oxoguanine DNA glycosylase [Streptomyces sp. 136MFCol5.1]SFT14450.1 3-methyladenine DNA glycosylase/8-oxoguanine DNA glycosylase [Streptomyces sp. ok210]
MAGRFAPRSAPSRSVPRQAAADEAPQAPGALHRPESQQAPGAQQASEALTREWTPPGPLDLRLVLAPLRRGPADPTFRIDRDGSVWRATRTPAGPGALHLTDRGGRIGATAWGPGAAWLLDQLPTLLGAQDEPEAFRPRHRLVAAAQHRRPGLRLLRTGLVLESLIPSILEQKVTTDEAYRAWRLLVRTYGTPAPGPAATLFTTHGLHVMPDPRTWSLIPSWEWHRAGVDAKRSATILRAVRVARRLEEAATMPLPEATARLELIPGIGPWTSAETLQRANGAADAVTVGDLHLPGIIGHALAGNRNADDEEMLTLLAPYEGQRHRATRLILLSGHTPSRRAPRMTRGDIARL